MNIHKYLLEYEINKYISPYYCRFWTSLSTHPFMVNKFNGGVVQDGTVYLYFKVKRHFHILSTITGRLDCYGTGFDIDEFKSKNKKLSRIFKKLLNCKNKLINQVFDTGFYGRDW